MKLKTVRKLNKKISITSVLVALSFVVAIALTGFLYAKYIKELPYSGNVTISADLAGTFELYEHEAIKNNDGSYTLHPSNKVDGNTYTVLPGLDVPKDPTIEITGKTNIPAYLYIEVVDNMDKENSKITYDLTDDWVELTGAAPKHTNGKIYVYANGGTPVVFNGSPADSTIQILDGNIINVGQFVPHGDATKVDISFYAYMAQKNGNAAPDIADALRVYTENT